MTLAQILKLTSNRLDDTKEPYHWSDEELTAYLNQRLNELLIDIPLIADTTNPFVVKINIVAGTSVYAIDERITTIQSAKLASWEIPLDIRPMDNVRSMLSIWESMTGTPLILVTDYQAGSILLIPKPTESDTLYLQTTRMGLQELDYEHQGSEISEISSRLHALLIPGITSLAYRKADAETEDLKRAMADELEWKANVERMKKYYINLHGAAKVAMPHYAFI